jgi:hypothetical protein
MYKLVCDKIYPEILKKIGEWRFGKQKKAIRINNQLTTRLLIEDWLKNDPFNILLINDFISVVTVASIFYINNEWVTGSLLDDVETLFRSLTFVGSLYKIYSRLYNKKQNNFNTPWKQFADGQTELLICNFELFNENIESAFLFSGIIKTYLGLFKILLNIPEAVSYLRLIKSKELACVDEIEAPRNGERAKIRLKKLDGGPAYHAQHYPDHQSVASDELFIKREKIKTKGVPLLLEKQPDVIEKIDEQTILDYPDVDKFLENLSLYKGRNNIKKGEIDDLLRKAINYKNKQGVIVEKIQFENKIKITWICNNHEFSATYEEPHKQKGKNATEYSDFALKKMFGIIQSLYLSGLPDAVVNQFEEKYSIPRVKGYRDLMEYVLSSHD